MHKPRSCPSKAALEEHVVAARLGRPNRAVEAHLAQCKRCRNLAKKLAEEAQELAVRLGAPQPEPETPCPDDTVLAAYIDQALDPRERRQMESHAARCPKCRNKLKNIHRDTNDAVSEQAPPYAPTDQIKLADRKRTKRTSKKKPNQKSQPVDFADAEPRKKRLSSDFD